MYTKPLSTFAYNYYTFNGSDVRRTLYEFTGSKSGEKVVDWKEKIKSGSDATSNYSLDRYDVLENEPGAFSSSGHAKRNDGSYFYDVSCSGSGWYSPLSSSDLNHMTSVSSAANARALTKLYSRLREISYGVNGLLVLGELRETIRMLRNPADSILKATQKYLKRVNEDHLRYQRLLRKKKESTYAFKRRRESQLLNAITGSWLEYQFGVKPFLNDVEEISSTVVDLLTQPSQRQRVSSAATDDPVVYVEDNVDGLNPVTILNNSRVRVSVGSVRYVCGVRSDISANPGPFEIASKLGIQLQNFIPTIYELIPYSFLIDYFVNLGDMIESACTSTSNVTFKVKTTKLQTVFTRHTSMAQPPDNASYASTGLSGSGHLGKFQARRTTLAREKLDNLPLPSLVFTIPGGDSTKWYNMAALLGNQGKAGFRR